MDRAPRGVGIVAVVLIIAMLSMIGAVIALLVASGAVAKANDLAREKALALIHAGFEYGLMRIHENASPDGDSRSLGSGAFTVSYDSQTGRMIVASNVSAMQGSAAPSFAIQGPAGQAMGNCLAVNTGGAALANANRRLQGIALKNDCGAALTIVQMTVSWNPAGAERMGSITIGGRRVYDNPSGVASGTTVAISSTVIGPCGSANLAIDFNAGMLGKNFTIAFRMLDNSAKTAFVQFVAGDEAACLNVDMSAAMVGFTGFVRLLGGALTNSCTAPTSIRVDKMAVAWSPITPARTMSRIVMGGRVVWNGPAVTSGTQIALTLPQTIAGGASLAQNYLNFNADMRGYNYTITYTMRDNTAKVVGVDLYAANMNACLGVINTGCSIGAPATDIVGQQWQNTCALSVVIDRIRTTHTAGRLRDIVVNGTSVWPGGGPVASGTTVNIANVQLPGSAAYPVTRYRFNASMTGRRITSHTFTFFPTATTYTVNSNCP